MDAPLQLIVVAFEGEKRAGEALKSLKKWADDADVDIKNTAVLIKDKDGKVKAHEGDDVGAGAGAVFGAVAGGLIGLLGGPAGAIVGAAAGAVTGGVTAEAMDMGFSDEDVKALRDSLPPRSSALVALVEHTWAGKIADEVGKYDGRVFRQPVRDDFASRYQTGTAPQDRQIRR